MIPRRQKTLLHWMFVAMGALLLGQVFSMASQRPRETVAAVLYTGGDPIRVAGTVIRQETALTIPDGGSWTVVVDSGEKVAAGQTLAVREQPAAAENAARRVRVLRVGISAATQPLPVQHEALHTAIAALNAGDAAARLEQAEQITGLLSAGAGAEVLETELEQAEQRLRLWSESGGETMQASEAGIFAAAADGLEGVLTPETPEAAISLPVGTGLKTAGRIITGDTWYYRVELPFVPEEGQALRMELMNGIFEEAEMTVESVTVTPQGSQVLLSCGEYGAAVAELRTLTVKILKDSKTGLEIPAQAVYTVGEETGVWCLVGDSTRWKPVTILEDLGETVLVELDRSSTDNLWPGDAVLLD